MIQINFENNFVHVFVNDRVVKQCRKDNRGIWVTEIDPYDNLDEMKAMVVDDIDFMGLYQQFYEIKD